MEVEVMRHHGGAKNADSDIEHFAIAQDFGTRDEADGGRAPERMGKKDFVGEAGGNRGDKRDDEGFHQAKAAALQRENQENVASGNENTGQERQSKKKLESDRRAQDFCKIAGGDSRFTNDPQKQSGASGIVLAASLGEVPSRGNTELCGKRLQKHRQKAADEDNGKKRVAEFRATADVRSPVARVHVADGNQIARPGECQDLAEPGSPRRKRDGAMSLRQRGQIVMAGCRRRGKEAGGRPAGERRSRLELVRK